LSYLFHSFLNSCFSIGNGAFDSTLDVLASTLDFLTSSAILDAAVVQEDTSDLSAAGEEEEEVYCR
jgi:hypothetical protein